MLAAAFPLVPVLILVFLIVFVAAIAFLVFQIWDKQPWWRASPKPRKSYKDDKETVKIWRLHKKYPDAFPFPVPVPVPTPKPESPVEQQVIDDIIKDVVDKDKDL